MSQRKKKGGSQRSTGEASTRQLPPPGQKRRTSRRGCSLGGTKVQAAALTRAKANSGGGRRRLLAGGGGQRTHGCGGDPSREVFQISMTLRVNRRPPSSESLGEGWERGGKCYDAGSWNPFPEITCLRGARNLHFNKYLRWFQCTH